MGIFDAIGSLFKAVAGVFGFAQTRTEEKNTVDQRSNAEAAQIAADRDKARRDIASGDPKALEKDVS